MRIVVIEGMGNLGYIKRGLVDPLHEKHKGRVFFSLRAHNQKFSYSEVKGNILVGHSLGGETALELAGLDPAGIITLDPRRHNLLSWLDWVPFLAFQKPFTVPLGIPTENFYRTGFMNGYSVTGAKNTKLAASVSHGAVPAHPEVMKTLERMLGL